MWDNKTNITAKDQANVINNTGNNVEINNKVYQNFISINNTYPKTYNNLVLLALIGSWDGSNHPDKEIMSQLLDIHDKSQLNLELKAYLNTPETPLSIKNNIYNISNRIELLQELGSYILDEDLDRFKEIAIQILSEKDPAFDYDPDKRYMAGFDNKKLQYSGVLRKNICEGIAILGNNAPLFPQCSQFKPQNIVAEILHSVLDKATWQVWGSLNNLLPDLAEASPDTFLSMLEKAIISTPSPFDELFNQERPGFMGNNYMTGLLWGLERLAWDEEYLVRVAVILGQLANRDPGGSCGNRPINSLVSFLLPWFPQTLDSVDKSRRVIKSLKNENRELTFKVLLELFSNKQHQAPARDKPRWYKQITDDQFRKKVDKQECHEQSVFFAEQAVDLAGMEYDYLIALVNNIEKLLPPVFEQFLDKLNSDEINNFSDENKTVIWKKLAVFIQRNRNFSDAYWALSEKKLQQIQNVADKFKPSDCLFRNRYLFLYSNMDLYESVEGDYYQEQEAILLLKRQNALKEIYEEKGVDGILEVANIQSSKMCSFRIGALLSQVVDQSKDYEVIISCLKIDNRNIKNLAYDYINQRYRVLGWQWAEPILQSLQDKNEINQFLSYLPFEKEIYDKVSLYLKEDEGLYWQIVNFSPYLLQDDLDETIIRKLLEYNRYNIVIDYLALKKINPTLCIEALLGAVSSKAVADQLDRHTVTTLIQYVQSCYNDIDNEQICQIEWIYLQWLQDINHRLPRLVKDIFSISMILPNQDEDTRDIKKDIDIFKSPSPIMLYYKLANNPEFFCELIQILYKSSKEEQDHQSEKPDSGIISIIILLFKNWNIVPGYKINQFFNELEFNDWLTKVKEICTQSGYLDAAYINIGKVLIHSPQDPDGLDIHRAIAFILNSAEHDVMREGFKTAIYNSRGCFVGDETGSNHRFISKAFNDKAEFFENEGYQRVAQIFKDLSQDYNRESEHEKYINS